MEDKKIKIVAIDDKPDNLIVLRALVNEFFPSYEYIAAYDGREGVELCRIHRPDLVLLDIVMPVMDGYEVCEILKGDELLRTIPVVMITASRIDKEGRIRALEAGADGFLTKPLDNSEFKAQVRSMLRIKELEDMKLFEKERLEQLVRERTKALEAEIEERKKIEQSLHQTNLKYEQAQRIAHIGNWEEDLETGELHWSAEMYRIFGMNPHEKLKFEEVRNFFPRKELIRFDRAIKDAIELGKEYRLDYEIVLADGTSKYIHDEGKVIRNSQGKPVSMIGTSHDITDRKLTENALKESEEHFQMLFDKAPVGYQSLDKKGRILSVNQTWLDTTGYVREEVIGRWFGDFLLPQYVETFSERFEQFKKQGKMQSEFELKKKDGSPLFIAFDSRIGHSTDGEIKQTHCVLNDITEKRIKELELKHSYEFTELLLKTFPFGINIVDESGKVLFRNDHLKELFGHNNGHKRCWEICREYRFQCFECPISVKEQIVVDQIRHTTGEMNGKSFDISHTGMIFKGQKAVLEIFQDVTQRKRDELIQKVLYDISSAVLTSKNVQELSAFIRKQLGQLIDTTNFFIAFYDAASGMLNAQYYADQKDQYDSWPADRSLSGIVVRKNQSLFMTIDEIEQLEQQGEIDRIGTNPKIWLGVPLRQDQKVIGAFVVQHYDDINAYSSKDLDLLEFISHQISIAIQRRKDLQELEIALVKAEESDALKTAFLSNMSHEIRTPMNGILGFSELLDDDELTREQRRSFLDIINTNCQHLLSIINDILDIARIDSNQLVIIPDTFDLHHLLDELLISYDKSKVSAGKEHLVFHLEKHSSREVFEIVTDEVRLRQVLYNLLGNALKFTQQGFIKFGYRLVNEKLLFFVQDTGKGISKEKQQLIFERFRQEEETYTRQYGGNGLGLSISKKLVELLGGKMWLESEPDQGTIFYFTIS